MIWIHQRENWPDFSWDSNVLETTLADIRYKQGRLLGRMDTLRMKLRSEANLTMMTAEVVQSSAIEGEVLNSDEVRSSIARRLGLDSDEDISVGRDVEGIVEVMMDTTRNYKQPLTRERLFIWHAALFPAGRSGMRAIAVGQWRPKSARAMQVLRLQCDRVYKGANVSGLWLER